MSKGESDIDQITIKELLSRLRIGQLWAVVVVIAGLLGGSFTLGYKLSSSVAEPKIVKLETQVDTLRSRFEGLESKERFLALYLRYLLAKEEAVRVSSPENQRRLQDTKEAFENYLLYLWERHEEAEEDFEIEGLIVGKGPHPTEATVKFLYDGTIWPIPPEFRLAALVKQDDRVLLSNSAYWNGCWVTVFCEDPSKLNFREEACTKLILLMPVCLGEGDEILGGLLELLLLHLT